MDKIKIKIDGRIAEIESAPEVVADNAEYEIDFALDPREGWDISMPITALFVRRDGSYTARILDAGATSCTMPPQTGTNIVYVGLTQDDMRTTTPATIKVYRSIRTVASDPLPAPTEDVYAQILAAYAGIKILSGKGAPTSATQGKVNQLYRDEDTQKLYICTSTYGGYTWAAVVSDTEDAVTYTAQTLTEEQKTQARANIGAGTSNFSGLYNDLPDKPNIPAATVIDTTLSKFGQAADAKAAGDAIGKKIDAPHVAQVGEVLTVEEVDADGKPKKWKTSPAAAKQKQADWNQNDETAADYVKNRPFYTDIIEKTFESSADNNYIEFNGVPFEAGDSVDITVDGEIFTLIAQADANPEFPEMIFGAYIGDSYDELQSGSGQYGWRYYYFKEGNVSGIQSFENHIFIYKTLEDHKLDMKYSPVKLKMTNMNEEITIDTLYFNSNIYQKGLYLDYDESKNQFELTAIDNNQTCSVTLVLSNGLVIGDTLNKEYTFDDDGSIKLPYQKGLFSFQSYRIVFNGFVLNNRGYYAVITSTTENQYTDDAFANTKHYTGTFATVEGYLYFVDLEIVTSAEDEVQTATVKAKRIM